MQEFAAARMARYKAPRYVNFVDEFPITAPARSRSTSCASSRRGSWPPPRPRLPRSPPRAAPGVGGDARTEDVRGPLARPRRPGRRHEREGPGRRGFRSGFAGVMSQPSFGAERRGAPVTASTRPRTRTDPRASRRSPTPTSSSSSTSRCSLGGPTAGLKSGDVVIVNSLSHRRSASDLGIEGRDRRDSDVTGAAESAGLIVGGAADGIDRHARRGGGRDCADRHGGAPGSDRPRLAPGAARKNFEAAVFAAGCTSG